MRVGLSHCVALLAVFPLRIAAVVIIPTNTSEIRLPAYSWNQFLGVTTINYGPDAPNVMVHGPLYRFEGDSCDPNVAIPDDFTGMVVYIQQPITCPYFIAYDKFADRNATAIIRAAPFSIGDFYFVKSQYDHRTDRNNNVVLVQLILNQIGNDDRVLESGAIVFVRADVDPKIVERRTWWYQILIRWIPALINFISFALAARFLYGHVRVIRRPAPFLRSITLVHVALLIALVRNLIMGLFTAISGSGTDPAVSYEVQYAFSNGLMGWENAISIITARFWHQVISKADVSAKSFLFSGIAASVFTVFALVTEVYATYMMVTLQETFAGINVKFVFFGVILFLLMMVWLYFIISICMFQIRIMKGVSNAASSSRMFVQRLRRLVVLSSIITLLYFYIFIYMVMVLMESSDLTYMNLLMAIGSISMAIKSTLSILMLKPRSKDGDYRDRIPKQNQVTPALESQRSPSTAKSSTIVLLRRE